MFLPGSYLVSIRQLLTYELLRLTSSGQYSGGVMVMAIDWHARGAGSILFVSDFFF